MNLLGLNASIPINCIFYATITKQKQKQSQNSTILEQLFKKTVLKGFRRIPQGIICPSSCRCKDREKTDFFIMFYKYIYIAQGPTEMKLDKAKKTNVCATNRNTKSLKSSSHLKV